MPGYVENNDKLSGFKKSRLSKSIRLNYTLFRQQPVKTVLSYKP